MSNVAHIRKYRRKKSFWSFLRRRVFTAAHTQPWCTGCDTGQHHYGKSRQGCHCPCSSRH